MKVSVVLFKAGIEVTNGYGRSPLSFHFGSTVISSCTECRPVLPQGSYQIIEVNHLPVDKWKTLFRDHVAASSVWGRNYRLVRLLLDEQMFHPQIKLKVIDHNNKIRNIVYGNHKKNTAAENCVEGKRLSVNVYSIKLKSLWCDNNREIKAREEIYKNFYKAWHQALSSIKTEDQIVLDLRENGGGGDWEVQLVANTFLGKSVFMDEYRYLKTTQPGFKKIFFKHLPVFSDRWIDPVSEWTRKKYAPLSTLTKNKLVTIVSAGCFSSCETIASILKFEGRGKIVGSVTHGGAGEPVLHPIRGTPFSINLPACVVWQKNKTLYEGHGVEPHYFKVQSRYTTDDEVLRFALTSSH